MLRSVLAWITKMAIQLTRGCWLMLVAMLMMLLFGMFRWTNLQHIKIVYTAPMEVKHSCQCEPMPTLQVLAGLTREQIADVYHGYVNSIQTGCTNVARNGHVGDGGWNVCLDGNFKLQKPCLVYSFGINFDWSFDDSVALRYGCEVHAYDPSMLKVKDHDRKPNLHFHRTGLNNSDGTNQQGWRMRTFSSILKENGHSESTVNLLKIDIDYSEWWSFPEMLRSGSLKHVKQFCFEIHIKLKHHLEPSSVMYLKGLSLLRDLYHEGFRIFKTNRNMDARYKSAYGMLRTGCHEIYMIRNHTA